MREQKTAAVYNIQEPSCEKTAQWLEKQGWQVFRIPVGQEEKGEQISRLDMLVVGAYPALKESERAVIGDKIQKGLDYDILTKVILERAFAIHLLMESCIPALKAGNGKRIAVLTKRSASISYCEDQGNYAEHMIMAAVNMKLKFLFHRLRSEGFRFRCFAEEDDPKENDIPGKFCAGEYFVQKFSLIEREPAIHSEENRLVMRDGYLREIAW